MCGGESVFIYKNPPPPAALSRAYLVVCGSSFFRSSIFFPLPFFPFFFIPPFSCRAYVCRGGLDLKFNDAIHATEASPAAGNTILLSHI